MKGALPAAGVTARETEVLVAIGERLSNPEIADRLCVSKRTVESHVSALMQKLGADSRRELIALAQDLTGPPPIPPTRFVEVDRSYVAWSSFGDGQPVLFTPQWTSNIEAAWQEPGFTTFVRALAAVATVIQFDKRGCGASDGVIGDLDDAAADAIAVLTAADVDRAVVVAGDFGGFLALHLAAVHPERVAGLVLVNTTACVRQLPGYEIGLPDDILQARFDPLKRGWLDGADAADEPPRSEAPFVEVASRYRRSAVRLSDVRHLAVYLARLDLREEIRGIGCPTLVIHRRENEFIPSSHGHYLAHTVASSRFQEFPGAEQTMWAGDQADILETISEFIAALGTAHR